MRCGYFLLYTGTATLLQIGFWQIPGLLVTEGYLATPSLFRVGTAPQADRKCQNVVLGTGIPSSPNDARLRLDIVSSSKAGVGVLSESLAPDSAPFP